MPVDVQTTESRTPEAGQLAVVRGRQWVVADVVRSELPPDITSDVPPRRQHLVSLISVEDDATGEELTVVWFFYRVVAEDEAGNTTHSTESQPFQL
jgi:hypothetical protein